MRSKSLPILLGALGLLLCSACTEAPDHDTTIESATADGAPLEPPSADGGPAPDSALVPASPDAQQPVASDAGTALTPDAHQPVASDAITTPTPDASPPNDSFFFQQTFEASPLGTYTRDQMKLDFAPDLEHFGDPSPRCRIVDDPLGTGRGRVLAVGTDAGQLHGCFHAWMPLHQDFEELYFAYDVFFPAGFDFGKGAKLPGLYSKHYQPSSSMPGYDPNDCSTRIPDGTDRWSTGLMWHDLKREGEAEIGTYAYHINQPCYGSYETWQGKDGGPAMLPRGVWHTIELRVSLGAVEASDHRNDLVQGWLDGELVFEGHYTYRLPGGEDLLVGKLGLRTFYGGGADWAPYSDSTHYYDNFRVSTAPITH